MNPIFDSCWKCRALYVCNYKGFKTCHKIDIVSEEFGIEIEPKEDKSYLHNIPFGVFMTLKHMVEKMEGIKKHVYISGIRNGKRNLLSSMMEIKKEINHE